VPSWAADLYRHCCVQYSVTSWAVVSLTSLLSTVLSAIISRNTATATAVYSTQCHHKPQYRYRHWCVQYLVPSWAAVSLPSLVCTVLSAIISSNIANVTGVYSTQCHHEPQCRYRHCCVQHFVPSWAAGSLQSLLWTVLSVIMCRRIVTVTAVDSTQCHHEPHDLYRLCCVQYSVSTWAADSLTSLLSTVLSAIMSRNIATVTAVYSTQCRHEPHYRYRYCCVEYKVPPWAAVWLPLLVCTVLSAFMSRSIAIATGVYSTQCHHEPQDLYRHCSVQYLVSS